MKWIIVKAIIYVKKRPLEKTFVISTRSPANPKNISITTRNEFETAFMVVMLLTLKMKIINPKRHRTIPTNTPFVSKITTNNGIQRLRPKVLRIKN